jgi:hypothetical protein
MPPGHESPRPSPRLAKLGQIGASFALFLCGYLAFRSTDWRLTAVFSLLSVGAAILASRFAGMGR